MENHFVYNKQSKKVYKIIENDRMHRVIERVGDKELFSVTHGRFKQKYNVLEPSLVERVENNQFSEHITTDKLKKIEGGVMTSEIGLFIPYEDCNSLESTIIQRNTLDEIKLGLHKISKQDLLVNEWDLVSIPNFSLGQSLNLYGPPGTGKTMSAKAIAFELKMNILQVDYSEIVSKWVGDTGKNIKKIFDEAKKLNAIIFFDEADSLLSKRSSHSSGEVSNGANNNRNILMQEMDRFEGVSIFATNFFGNYDEAINRRIAQHIHFQLPDQAARKKIYKLHIPSAVPKEELDYSVLAKNSKGLSGGDIRNICINSIIKASMSKGMTLLNEHISSEIEKHKVNKENYGKK